MKLECNAKAGSRFNKRDADVIGPMLALLDREQKGLKPAEVVDAARDEESPIHPYFEWDDCLAAEEHRRQQAREMLRSITIKVIGSSGTTHDTRQYENVSVTVTTDAGEERTERRYVQISTIREEPVLAEQLLQQARSQLMAWRDKWAVVKDVCEPLRSVFDAINKLDHPQK